jgi:hypothetical protein
MWHSLPILCRALNQLCGTHCRYCEEQTNCAPASPELRCKLLQLMTSDMAAVMGDCKVIDRQQSVPNHHLRCPCKGGYSAGLTLHGIVVYQVGMKHAAPASVPPPPQRTLRRW